LEAQPAPLEPAMSSRQRGFLAAKLQQPLAVSNRFHTACLINAQSSHPNVGLWVGLRAFADMLANGEVAP
jgi:hypothetical protein